MSRVVVGIPWVLFVYPYCVSRCDIYLEKKEIMIRMHCFGKSARWRSCSRALAGGGASIYNSRWRAPSLEFNVATA